MVVPEPLRWLLTVALAGGTAFHLTGALRPRRVAEHRVAEALHAVMGLAMVTMLWPFGCAVPTSAWPVVFAGSAGWFAAHVPREAGRRIAPAYFASTAAAMVWMGSAMPAAPTGMPGMAHARGGRPMWTAAVIGGYLVVAGLGWLLSGLRLGALHSGTTHPAEEITRGSNGAGGSAAGEVSTGSTARATGRTATTAGGATPAGVGRVYAPARAGASGRAHWPALCHGIMGLSMGLLLLSMF